MRSVRLLAAFSVLTVWLGGAGHAEVRALLVGATSYHSKVIPDLQGPGNDLPAMEGLLRGQGATDITVLANENVTRTRIETALHSLGLHAKAGDWIVFYFSGHGARAEAAVKGVKKDDLDDFLVLPNFSLTAPDPETYVVSTDLRAWLLRYIPRNVTVLQVADACHSGTLNRSIDPKALRFVPRLAFRDVGDLKLGARPAPQFEAVLDSVGVGGDLASEYLPNAVYVGASQDDQFALEAPMPVEGAPSRGILTFSLEQALTTYGADGKSLAADANGDGVVSIGELAVFLDSQVRQLTGSQQEPSVKFDSRFQDRAIFTTPPAPATPPAEPKVAVYATTPAAAAALAEDGRYAVAATALDADFIWETAAGAVKRRSGDVVAERVTSIAALKGVLEKWATVEALRPLMAESRARVLVGPKRTGARYVAGQTVELTLAEPTAAKSESGRTGGYVTIFDLASDGRVQTLYPLAEDGEGRWNGGASLSVLKTEVVEPYGADHVIALVTPDRPDAFRALLRTDEGQRSSGRLIAGLRKALAAGGSRAALSIGELYTGPNP